jgi:hypothetical protein
VPDPSTSRAIDYSKLPPCRCHCHHRVRLDMCRWCQSAHCLRHEVRMPTEKELAKWRKP